MGVIDDLISNMETSTKDVFPKFISRDIPTQHAELMITTLGKLIYEISGSPNFSDDKFGSASGISLLYKLIGLEYSAAEVDMWHNMGMLNRNDLINQALRHIENNENIDKGYTPVIVRNRNIPLDVAYAAENATTLKDIGLSLQTVLSTLPKTIVPSVKAELENIATQQKVEPKENI